MLYRFDTISPLELLIPTLRFVKELEWIGHEFSKRLMDLKKFDKTPLRTRVGIYA